MTLITFSAPRTEKKFVQNSSVPGSSSQTSWRGSQAPKPALTNAPSSVTTQQTPSSGMRMSTAAANSTSASVSSIAASTAGVR
eukprot:1343834-Amorphochlora_amoeboformis.AAC.1